MPRFLPPILMTVACLGTAQATMAANAHTTSRLKQLSLDELMNVQVTSVSRTTERYQDVAAALAVVPQEQIRRSGATTIPDALRAVPGLHVARRHSSSWAVSSRGFSSINSPKLLVLSDTRSIYTPLFSGVFWDVQDYLLSDIDRIEVIRGPGAAMWGSNAVNGVINITTKHAADTHGTRVETVVGLEERAMVSARYGAETSQGMHYRVFGKFVERDGSFHAAVSDDDWRLGHLGFRSDWMSGADDEFTVQGDIYRGNIGQLSPSVVVGARPGPTGNLEARVSGGNILGRWRHHIDAGSDLQLRVYYDRTHRNDPMFTDDLDTFDLDLQHRFTPLLDHELIWGLNYRFTSNRNLGKGIFVVEPPTSRDNTASAFVQDQITWNDTFRLTLGSKFEENDFSDFEIQPSVRATWDIAAGHLVWAAISRAARIPTRLERDIAIDVGNPADNPIVRLLGDDEFQSEELLSYEIGYRWWATKSLHADVAVFDNHYDRLASLEFGTPFTDPGDGRTVVPIVNRNLNDGRAHGVETVVTYAPAEAWRVTASYSYLDLSIEPLGQDLNRGETFEGATPRHQFAASSYLTLPAGFEFDIHFRSHSSIRRSPDIPGDAGIPGYNELDLHLSWRASETMRLSIVGRNLLHNHHPEFGGPTARGEIERGVYGRIEWDL